MTNSTSLPIPTPAGHPPSENVTPLARRDGRVGAPRYVALSSKDGWQLLLEHADRYLRWTLNGEPGDEGVAVPGVDVASSSLEREGGSLDGKSALEVHGEIGTFENLREDNDDDTVAMSRCLDEGALELSFDGELMNGRWQLSRTGTPRTQPERWVLRRL